MESEKMMYWVTLGVLAMAAITGAVSGQRGMGRAPRQPLRRNDVAGF